MHRQHHLRFSLRGTEAESRYVLRSKELGILIQAFSTVRSDLAPRTFYHILQECFYSIIYVYTKI